MKHENEQMSRDSSQHTGPEYIQNKNIDVFINQLLVCKTFSFLMKPIDCGFLILFFFLITKGF